MQNCVNGLKARMHYLYKYALGVRERENRAINIRGYRCTRNRDKGEEIK